MMVGSTRKYGVKPLPKSKRSRRLCLLMGTSTACVAICTYPFLPLSLARVPSSKYAKCKYMQGDLSIGRDTYLHRRLLCEGHLLQWGTWTDTPPLATHYIILLVHDGLQIRRQGSQSICRTGLLGQGIMDAQLNGVADVRVEGRDRARLRSLEDGRQFGEER